MQKVYSATTYFIIGYTIIVATATVLSMLGFLPSTLRSSIGMVVAAIVFVDLSYRFFRKSTPTNETVKTKSVFKIMAYWAFLSILLDVLLMVIILPLSATGSMSLAFFSTQSSLYWMQFPMIFVFGLVGQAIYNKVVVITTANIDLN